MNKLPIEKKIQNLNAPVEENSIRTIVRIHQTLRVTPAMEAGITRKLWSWNDLLNLRLQDVA